MKNIFVIFGILMLVATSFARPAIDSYMEARYDNVECWADYADNLYDTIQTYYTDAGQTPPAYLQSQRETLWAEGGLMYTLNSYMMMDNRVAFDSQVPVNMAYIFSMSRSFRTEARYVFTQGWETRADVISDYSAMRSTLVSCLQPVAPG